MKVTRYIFASAAIFTVLGLGLFSACSRQLESRDPVRSIPEAPPTPQNVQVRVNDRAVTLTWELTDTAGVSRFRVYLADSAGGPFEVRDSTTAYTVSIDGLQVNRRYYFRVASVRSDGVEGTRSTAVSTTVALLNIEINNGNEYTNNRDVQVRLTAPAGTSYILLSEDSTLAGARVQSFAPGVSFRLSPGDGGKTVFGRFVFVDGSESDLPITDGIILDTRVAIDSVYFSPVGTTFQTGDTILLFLAGGEAGGEAQAKVGDLPSMDLYDDGIEGDAAAADGVFTGRYVIPTGVGVDNVPVIGSFTDAAGNAAPSVSSLATLSISSPPVPVQLVLVEALYSYQVDLQWTVAAGDKFASYRLYRDVTAGVDTDSELLTKITNRNTVTYEDTTVDDNTTYYYRVYVFNQSGLSSPSAVDSATTPVNLPPAEVVLSGQLQDATEVSLSWTANSDDDFASYRIYRDGSGVGDNNPTKLRGLITNRGTTTFTDYVSGSGSVYYWIYVYDRQGAVSGASNVVQITP